MLRANGMIDEVVKLISETVSDSSHRKYNEWLNNNAASSDGCRWFYCTSQLNNGLINYRLTLEAFAVIHIFESFPQLKFEIHSLIHPGRRSTSVYQFCQLIKSTFFNRGVVLEMRCSLPI